jgi:hypothetical protein
VGLVHLERHARPLPLGELLLALQRAVDEREYELHHHAAVVGAEGAHPAVDHERLAAADDLVERELDRVAQHLVERLDEQPQDLVARRVELAGRERRRGPEVVRQVAPEEDRRLDEARLRLDRAHDPVAELLLARQQQPVHVPQVGLLLDRAEPAGTDRGVRRLAQETVGAGADVAVLVDVLERLDDLVGDHRRVAGREQRVDADLGRLEVEVVDDALGRDHRQRLVGEVRLRVEHDQHAIGVARVARDCAADGRGLARALAADQAEPGGPVRGPDPDRPALVAQQRVLRRAAHARRRRRPR